MFWELNWVLSLDIFCIFSSGIKVGPKPKCVIGLFVYFYFLHIQTTNSRHYLAFCDQKKDTILHWAQFQILILIYLLRKEKKRKRDNITVGNDRKHINNIHKPETSLREPHIQFSKDFKHY